MPRLSLEVFGLEEVQAAISRMGPPLLNRLLGPSLGAAAAVVRDRARTKGLGFTDETGRLRASIRSGRLAARYGGRRYKRGRAGVFAGGEGARQAYLVEAGHGGPYPAAPRSYLFRALLETESLQMGAFSSKAREIFPRLAAQIAATGTGRGRATGALYGRTLARRARRG